MTSASAQAAQTRKNRRGHLQREAYRVLREMIVQQHFAPGVRLSETMLSRLTGYGRSPVRVALQGLAADGLVRIVPQSGVFVAPIDVPTELRVLEVRAELERLLVKCAAQRAAPDQRGRMRAIAGRLREVADQGDDLAFVKLLRDIHEVLTEAADNDFLTTVMERIHALSRRFWYAHHAEYGDLHRAAELHARRLALIARGDTVKAQAASDALIAHIEGFVRKTIASAEPAEATAR